MINNLPKLEILLKKHGISFVAAKRLAKKIVERYTSIDKHGDLEICFGGNCYETHLTIDKDYLIDDLHNTWYGIHRRAGVMSNLMNLMEDELGFEYDFSLFFTVTFLCPEIYEVYYKPLESDNINESFRNLIDNEDREFMFRVYKEMGLDEEWAQYDLEELLKWLDTLPEKIILYRLLYIDDDNIINREELGDHYTQEKESLLHNHYSKGSIYGGHWGNPVLLTVEADKDQIDILNTLHNNILYPHEEEITLKNKGRGVEFIKVEKL